MVHLLNNPFSQNSNKEPVQTVVNRLFPKEDVSFHNLVLIGDMPVFLSSFPKGDIFILMGGDGTLNRFVNDVYNCKIEQKIYLYPAGSGNDFLNDVRQSKEYNGDLIFLNPYIQHLPLVTVNQKKYRFINGIGYGLDGYCCEAGDIKRNTSRKPVNYMIIAIKGLLGAFHTVNATVTVDGISKTYKKVWLAPCMFGKYYGGGMKIAPNQDRTNSNNMLTSIVIFGCNRLKSLLTLPSFFKGNQAGHPEIIEVRTGHNITVEFDRPTALQIDGETISNVLSYSAQM